MSVPGAIHPERRLSIIAREDGGFSIAEQYFYRLRNDDGHTVTEGRATLPADGIFADEALALREIGLRLKDRQP